MTGKGPLIFGEVLFDIFPGGEQVLGGAPFNVAWHLQALGDSPCFISRVGTDPAGERILAAMGAWGMRADGVQSDAVHPTGCVEVEIRDDEPSYRIVPDCAYDFVAADQCPPPDGAKLLYHGSLALRQPVSRAAFEHLASLPDMNIFLDVNLRAPWWQKESLFRWLEQARWVKLNQHELELLGFSARDNRAALEEFLDRFSLEQLILTRGEAGSRVLTAAGDDHAVVPAPATPFVDSVGAGDAFSAVYIHGLLNGWSIPATLEAAQQFAARVIGLRGATTADPDFYHDYLASLPATARDTTPSAP